MAPGARLSKLEEPSACVLFLVGVLQLALLDNELNHEEDLVIQCVIIVFSFTCVESSF